METPDTSTSRGRWSFIGCLFAAILAAGAAPAENIATNPVVGLARRFAAQKLAGPACRGIYADFADESGRPLASRLDALGVSGTEHLAGLVFQDGDADPLCRDSDIMAFTSVGSSVVHVCTSRFIRRAARHMAFATASVLHEQLHTLGLLENPPTSREITERVLQHCGR